MTGENAVSIRPHQIIVLEHQVNRLYAEAIDVVPARRLCWARPLLLVTGPSGEERDWLTPEAALELYPLQEGPDLLWPVDLFQPALDVEVLTLLGQAQALPPDSRRHQLSLQHLRHFIQQVWRAYPQLFAKQSSQSVNSPRSEKDLPNM
ncbi:hypothetical protein [Almyronema epifaneia]|uniref:hypothetical protein n=1 Tax=Almyronema epifaneia TaxID=3114805 RepID=UPI00366DAC2A